MDSDDIKRKLRELKRLERKLRDNNTTSQTALVWDSFFDLHEISKGASKYTLSALSFMSKDEYKHVINEYWAFVYYALFKEYDQNISYDTNILIKLDLPFDADEKAVKKRFRELAKHYHPDTGGDASKFIELMDDYRKLISK